MYFCGFKDNPLLKSLNTPAPIWIIGSKKNYNRIICMYAIFPQLQKHIEHTAGRRFSLNISLPSERPWITMSMFSLSALFERRVLYLASKACHRLPAVCHFISQGSFLGLRVTGLRSPQTTGLDPESVSVEFAWESMPVIDWWIHM